MNDVIDKIITTIINTEGGYVNHPSDKGGPTNMGVTQRTLSGYLGRPASIDDVKNLEVGTAREIYERSYLTGPRIDKLPNPPMAFVFDMSINHGPRNAIRILQRVINGAGFGPMTVDGVLGPITRQAALNAQTNMGNAFQNALVAERIQYYQGIVHRDPSQKVFLEGWLNRANKYKL